MPNKKQKKIIQAYGLLADDELIAIANKEIKIDFLDRGDFISKDLKVVPVQIKIISPKK